MKLVNKHNRDVLSPCDLTELVESWIAAMNLKWLYLNKPKQCNYYIRCVACMLTIHVVVKQNRKIIQT